MSNILEADIAQFTTDVTLTTTSETIVVTSPQVVVPYVDGLVAILAWAQLTTGVGATAVTPRIRAGSLVTGTLIGEANAEQVKAAAGSTEPFVMLLRDVVRGVNTVQYVFTLQQTAATGNATALQGSILVLVMEGSA